MFDLGEGLLDGIEVWRIGRQEPEPCAGLLDQLAYLPGFVAAQIVHDDDVTAPQRRDELLGDIGLEALAIDRAVEDTGRGETIGTQRADEGQCAPMAMRSKASQSFALDTPAVKGSHIGFDPVRRAIDSLDRLLVRLTINEHEPVGIEALLPRLPALAPTGDVSARLLNGKHRLW